MSLSERVYSYRKNRTGKSLTVHLILWPSSKDYFPCLSMTPNTCSIAQIFCITIMVKRLGSYSMKILVLFLFLFICVYVWYRREGGLKIIFLLLMWELESLSHCVSIFSFPSLLSDGHNPTSWEDTF